MQVQIELYSRHKVGEAILQLADKLSNSGNDVNDACIPKRIYFVEGLKLAFLMLPGNPG